MTYALPQNVPPNSAMARVDLWYKTQVFFGSFGRDGARLAAVKGICGKCPFCSSSEKDHFTFVSGVTLPD